jgi:hypothetical protein
MAEKKVPVVTIKRAVCFEGDRGNRNSRCVRNDCGLESDCMWKKDPGELSPQLGSMPENRKTILSR